MLAGLSLGMLAFLVALGIALDFVFGEARRFHPLVGFGNYASQLERRLNCGGGRHWRGLLAWLLAVLPLVMLAVWAIGLIDQVGTVLEGNCVTAF